MADNAKWFVIHTYSGYENKVASNIKTVAENRGLQDEILDVVIPVASGANKTEDVDTEEKPKVNEETKAEEKVQSEEDVKAKEKAKADDDDDDDDFYFEDDDDESEVKKSKTKKAKDSKTEKKSKSVKRKTEDKKLFPGYVFVKAVSYKKKEPTSAMAAKAMSEGREDLYPDDYDEITTMSDEAWYIIRNTRGVTGFVGPDSKPSPLSNEELVYLGLAEYDETHEESSEVDDYLIDIFSIGTEVDYKVGDRVSVISGPWEGQIGQVKSIDLEKEVVTVNLHMMGRETPTEFSLDEVELA